MAIGDVLQILPSGLAGFAPPPAPAGLPTYLEVTHNCPAGAVAVNFDFDFAAFVDAAIDVQVKVLGTTKGGGLHLIGAIDFGALAGVETRNGVIQLMAPAAGGYKNVFQTQPDTIPILVGGNDNTLVSGGFSPMSVQVIFPGAGILRVICTNMSAVNDADTKVRLECMIKAAP